MVCKELVVKYRRASNVMKLNPRIFSFQMWFPGSRLTTFITVRILVPITFWVIFACRKLGGDFIKRQNTWCGKFDSIVICSLSSKNPSDFFIYIRGFLFRDKRFQKALSNNSPPVMTQSLFVLALHRVASENNIQGFSFQRWFTTLRMNK